MEGQGLHLALGRVPSGACRERIDWGPEVRGLGGADPTVLGVGATCESLSHLPGAQLRSMIQRFQS